jgi:hypothetical protein
MRHLNLVLKDKWSRLLSATYRVRKSFRRRTHKNHIHLWLLRYLLTLIRNNTTSTKIETSGYYKDINV